MISGEFQSDFIGVKIGDVDYSADSDLSTRSSKGLVAKVIDKNKIGFYLKESAEFYGLQMALKVPIGGQIVLESSKENVLQIEDYHYLIDHENIIHLSYNSSEIISSSTDDILFTITLEGAHANEAIMGLTLEHQLLDAEYYDEHLKTYEFSIEIENPVTGSEGFLMYQNEPNPFIDETTIKVENLGKTAQGSIAFYTVDGRIIRKMERSFETGMNELYLSKEDFIGHSIVFYQLTIGTYSEVKKMILIQ